MLVRCARHPRSGAVMLEAAIVLPILFLIILGTSLLGLAVFRYQQVATVAREAARWASVHGGQYASETGHAMATPQSIYNATIQPFGTALNQSGMVFDSSGGTGTALSFTVNWLDASQMPTFKDGAGNTVVNTVTVVINYTSAGGGIIGPMTLTSSSAMPMSY